MSVKTTHAVKKFVLRLPTDTHKKILVVAQHNRRSMNAEIIHLIHTHLSQPLFSPLIINSKPCHDDVGSVETFLALFDALPKSKQDAIMALLSSLNA